MGIVKCRCGERLCQFRFDVTNQVTNFDLLQLRCWPLLNCSIITQLVENTRDELGGFKGADFKVVAHVCSMSQDKEIISVSLHRSADGDEIDLGSYVDCVAGSDVVIVVGHR